MKNSWCSLCQYQYLHFVWLDEDVVQAAMKPSHIIGVGRLGTGT